MGSWKRPLMARVVDCSWFQLVSHALKLLFKKRKIKKGRVRRGDMVEKKRWKILVFEICVLSRCIANGKRSSPFFIANSLLMHWFHPHGLLVPIRAIRSTGDVKIPPSVHVSVHVSHTSPRPRRKTLLPRQHISHLWSWCQGVVRRERKYK